MLFSGIFWWGLFLLFLLFLLQGENKVNSAQLGLGLGWAWQLSKKYYPLEIDLHYNHNHPVDAADALRFRPVSQETKELFTELFDDDLSPSSAYMKVIISIAYMKASPSLCIAYMEANLSPSIAHMKVISIAYMKAS